MAPRLRRAAGGRPWTFVHQVHGAGVVVVEEPSGPRPDEGDALVTSSARACVAVLGADCALVGLASVEGVVCAAHAGWRGLVAGVLARAADEMRALGSTEIVAVLGPCIHAECYEFGEAELAVVERHLGRGVRAETSAGRPALDLPAGVRHALREAGVELVGELGGCTACDGRWFSHRARRETSRHALAIWREPPSPLR